MSDSEWNSDSGASDDEASASSALNRHLVQLVTLRHLPRVTHRRRAFTTGESAWATDAEISHQSRVTGEAPRTKGRIDLRSLIRQALSQSNTQCPSANVDDVASRVVAALRQSADGPEMARAVTCALADPLYEKLREDVLSGRLRPEDTVALDEVSLLNQSARAALEEARLERLNQQSVEYLERLRLTVTNMFTCPECGSCECYAHFRSTDFVKWQGDDQTPTLLRCCKCSLSFRQ
ncbi:hypothetical protein GH5_04764 [Leishmania sp. Ghana 2012 LV757]|uniref:hypothetical protein n=1 Tax=Leishmania sp. Ghana 2012 LV757 TaxID=2803181 RepID=UPI001B49672C|nr:hypothetical protein GH5_04764 [Leishmania sp. Ghana 2012 LV757]